MTVAMRAMLPLSGVRVRVLLDTGPPLPPGTSLANAEIQQQLQRRLELETTQMLSDLGATLLTGTEGEQGPEIVVACWALAQGFLEAVHAPTRPKAVTADWVAECSRLASKVLTDPFELPPLAGLQVCVTGFNEPDDRESLPLHIQALGACYNRDMRKGQCTHLVAKSRSGDKYRHALTWGNVRIVDVSWLLDCIRYQMRQDEARHIPPEPEPPAILRGPRGGAVAVTPCALSSFTVRATEAVAEATAAKQAARKSLAAGHTLGGNAARAQSQPPVPKSSCVAAAIMEVVGGGAASRQPSGPHAQVQAQQQQQQQQQDSVGGAALRPVQDGEEVEAGALMDDHFYMGWVRLHPLGCTSSEISDMVRLCCACGATREPDLHPDITHVLLGADVTPQQLTVLREHLTATPHCKVVKLAWLQHCVLRHCYVEVDGTWAVPQAELQPPAAAGARLPGLARVASTYLPDDASRPAAGPGAAGVGTGAGAQAPGIAGGCEGGETAAAAGTGARGALLQGLWFTLAAVSDTEEATLAGQLIWANGGKIFAATSARMVPDPSKAFAICPHGLPEERQVQLEKTCEDFRVPPASQRVTLYWLQSSVDSGQLQPFDARNGPAFRPLPFNLPLKSFKDVRLHASSYLLHTKQSLQYLITLLGGTYTDSLSKASTHLLTQEAEGPKYKMAVRWNMSVVNASWLIDSAYRGMPLGPEGYAPRVPEGAAAAGTGAGAPGGFEHAPTQGVGALPSQLNATQIPGRPTSSTLAPWSAAPSGTATNSHLAAAAQPSAAAAAAGAGSMGPPAAPSSAAAGGLSRLQAALMSLDKSKAGAGAALVQGQQGKGGNDNPFAQGAGRQPPLGGPALGAEGMAPGTGAGAGQGLMGAPAWMADGANAKPRLPTVSAAGLPGPEPRPAAVGPLSIGGGASSAHPLEVAAGAAPGVAAAFGAAGGAAVAVVGRSAGQAAVATATAGAGAGPGPGGAGEGGSGQLRRVLSTGVPEPSSAGSCLEGGEGGSGSHATHAPIGFSSLPRLASGQGASGAAAAGAAGEGVGAAGEGAAEPRPPGQGQMQADAEGSAVAGGDLEGPASPGSIDDNVQVIAQINNLISIKERAGSLGRPTGFLGDLSNCSQIDLPPLPLPLPTPAGASAKDAMASDQSLLGRGTAGAARRPGQDGERRGGHKRHASGAPEGPEGSRRRGSGAKAHSAATSSHSAGLEDELVGGGDMSQQVGYDMGLPAERLLTRHRAKAQATNKGGAGAAGGVDVGTRQQIISRVKGQGRSGRG